MYFFRVVIFLWVIVFSSCSLLDSKRGDQKIARAYNHYLYKTDLDGLIPDGTSYSDSILIAKGYIENWIKQQVYLEQAQNNLANELLSVERKVQDYRNSLIIFEYENQLVKEQLDTVINDSILKEYYQKHQNEFKLRDHIVKVNFIKLPIDAPEINLVRRLIRSQETDDIQKLEEYCINNAAGYFLDQDAWFIFTDILREIPLNPTNYESYLRNTKNVELRDQFYRYFLYIRDYKLEGSTSPLAFQSENIKAIILNHRKQNLVNNFRQDLYLNAIRNSQIEIFNN